MPAFIQSRAWQLLVRNLNAKTLCRGAVLVTGGNSDIVIVPGTKQGIQGSTRRNRSATWHGMPELFNGYRDPRNHVVSVAAAGLQPKLLGKVLRRQGHTLRQLHLGIKAKFPLCHRQVGLALRWIVRWQREEFDLALGVG